MNKELIQQIANEIINASIIGNVKFYVLILAITLVSSAVSVFLYSYFKKRGESYATKSDFDDILSQLKTTTSVTEEIRSEILSKTSREKDQRKIIRAQLENIIEESFKINFWLEQSRTSALMGEVFNINGGHLEKVEMLQMIYFQDFEQEVNEIRKAINPYIAWVLGLHAEHWESAKNNRLPNYDIDQFKILYPPIVKVLTDFRKNISDKYRTLII